MIKISLKFVPKGPVDNIPALCGPMVVSLLIHICVIQPQWVKCECSLLEIVIWLSCIYIVTMIWQVYVIETWLHCISSGAKSLLKLTHQIVCVITDTSSLAVSNIWISVVPRSIIYTKAGNEVTVVHTDLVTGNYVAAVRLLIKASHPYTIYLNHIIFHDLHGNILVRDCSNSSALAKKNPPVRYQWSNCSLVISHCYVVLLC